MVRLRYTKQNQKIIVELEDIQKLLHAINPSQKSLSKSFAENGVWRKTVKKLAKYSLNGVELEEGSGQQELVFTPLVPCMSLIDFVDTPSPAVTHVVSSLWKLADVSECI